MIHHPALAESGELEIAQRQALHEAVEAARLGTFDSGDDQVRASVEAYLTAMRRSWQPRPIKIDEGDHVVVEIAEQLIEVHAGTWHGDATLKLAGRCDLEGIMPGEYVVRPST